MTAAQGPPDAARAALWESPEVAWPLALAGGFAGTWAGLAAGVPGVAALLATAALVPLHLAFARRGAPGLAALLGLGWVGGIAGAVVGSVLEGSGSAVRDALLFPDPLIEAAGANAAGLHLALFAAVLLAAHWTRGIAALVAASAVGGSAAWVAAERALPAVSEGAAPLLATLYAAPPSLGAEALALVLAAVALAGAGGERERARPLLWGALGLEILALAGWSLR